MCIVLAPNRYNQLPPCATCGQQKFYFPSSGCVWCSPAKSLLLALALSKEFHFSLCKQLVLKDSFLFHRMCHIVLKTFQFSLRRLA
jgi:hypothetical protein